MDDKPERRSSERFVVSEPIKFAHSNTRNIFHARLINCSEDGIYFESQIGLQPGTYVFIAGFGDNKFFRAEVKWCKNLDHDGVYDFGIGAKYCDPVS
jgi:hypothetical protein